MKANSRKQNQSYVNLEICEMVEPKVMESDDGWALIGRFIMTKM